MFELTTAFGDIYEGHIVRINQSKLVLLLSSTYHSDVKLARFKNCKEIMNNSINVDNTINSVHTYYTF